MKQQSKFQQHGGTILGLIIGVVIGLAGALAVAVYVTKVPVPFLNKGQSRSAEQDAAEAKKNKDWDPNAPLYGKNPAKPAPPAGPEATPPATATQPSATVKPELKPAVSADPLGDLVKAKAGMTAADQFYYFVQVGAFKTMEDAESHRAKLQLSGIESKVTEREQSGHAVFRVRVGPFDKKEEADKSKEKLDQAGLATSLVRVQRAAP
jgi:cell division protein FtsN